jgi:TPR repeat protein
MKCVLCHPFKWLRTKLPAQCVADRLDVREKLESWRYAQANDTDVIKHDPDYDALLAAERLWRSDPETAFPQLSVLAERGSVWSMLLVGYAYQAGQGVTADLAAAERWYRLAFEAGCQQATPPRKNLCPAFGLR